MSLEIKQRIGNFKEIRFLSKSQSLVADLNRSIPRLLKSKLLRLVNNNYIKHTKISSEEISDGRKYSLLFHYVKVEVSC